MNIKKFTLYLVTFVLSLFSLIAVFNYIVDPYGIYRFVEIEGFNKVKPSIYLNDARAKIQKIKIVQPQAIILGSSRSEIALDPDHKAWSSNASPHYNMAAPYTSMLQAKNIFDYANSIRPLKQVVLGLDLGMFRAKRRSVKKNVPGPVNTFKDKNANFPYPIYNLFSFDSTLASFNTLFNQDIATRQHHSKKMSQRDAERFGAGETYLYNGRRLSDRIKQNIQQFGQKRYIQRILERYKRSRIYQVRRLEDYFYYHGETSSSMFVAFKNLLIESIKADIDIKLFISPVHIKQYEISRNSNASLLYDMWKGILVSIVNEVNQFFPNNKPVLLWDFSGYNQFTTEKLPSNDKEIMQWYWEPSHYKKELGDIILQTILTGKPEYDDFGKVIAGH